MVTQQPIVAVMPHHTADDAPYCSQETAENKLIYMELFHKYTHMIEHVIDSKLHELVDGFSMAEFSEMLDARKDELDAEVFDLVLSMADFEAFRELMLAYRAEVEGGKSFEITCTHLRVHTEEVEDGQHRPDLDLGLSVSGLSPRKA
jgi:ADP-ribosylation factor-like protein 2-binding protein